MKLTIHLHLVTMLRIGGAIYLLLYVARTSITLTFSFHWTYGKGFSLENITLNIQLSELRDKVLRNWTRLWYLIYFLLFQITNLMHNSFILQQYICYITILNMFRAAPCSSSGGQIVLLQPLVSSLCKQPYSMPVESSQPAYCTAVYREWRYQRLW